MRLFHTLVLAQLLITAAKLAITSDALLIMNPGYVPLKSYLWFVLCMALSLIRSLSKVESLQNGFCTGI